MSTTQNWWWLLGDWLAWCRFERELQIASNGAYHVTTGWSIQR